jgi:NTE family protein
MNTQLGLVVSGGGAKGAFAVGVISALMERFPVLRWHVVAGTSTGALIAPFAALAAADPTYLERLKALYRNATRDSIIRSNFRFPRLIMSLFNLPTGFYSVKPLKGLIQEHIGAAELEQLEESPTATVITAVDLRAGRLVLCTPDNRKTQIEAWYQQHSESVTMVGFDHFRTMMLASAAMPAIMEAVDLDALQLCDGGVFDVAPLREAVAAGATAAIVILLSRREAARVSKIPHLIGALTRAIDLLTNEILRNDVARVDLARRLRAMRAFPEAAPLLEAARGESDARLADYLRGGALTPFLIEPGHDLGDALDFDSTVPSGWPESNTGRPVRIMEARYQYGRRIGAQLLASTDLAEILTQ